MTVQYSPFGTGGMLFSICFCMCVPLLDNLQQQQQQPKKQFLVINRVVHGQKPASSSLLLFLW
jgi:hypothetical protein